MTPCKYSEDTGVFWCCNTWTKTRVICKNPFFRLAMKKRVPDCAATMYTKTTDDDKILVKSDVCRREHCLYYEAPNDDRNDETKTR